MLYKLNWIFMIITFKGVLTRSVSVKCSRIFGLLFSYIKLFISEQDECLQLALAV